MGREISLESSRLLYSVDGSHKISIATNEEVNVNSDTELDKVDKNNSDQESLRHSLHSYYLELFLSWLYKAIKTQ